MRRSDAISRYLVSALCLASGLLLAGCGKTGSLGRTGEKATPQEQALHVHQAWASNVANFRPAQRLRRHPVISGIGDPRLGLLSRRYGFTVVSFEYLRAKNSAALTVKTGRRPVLFVDDVSKIEEAMDPSGPSGLGYSAFFFEAQNTSGTPFIATEHSVWGTGTATEVSQWAGAPNLFIAYRGAMPPEP